MNVSLEQDHVMVASYIRGHPNLSFQQMAVNLGVAMSSVSRIAKKFGLSRPKRRTSTLTPKPSQGGTNDRSNTN